METSAARDSIMDEQSAITISGETGPTIAYDTVIAGLIRRGRLPLHMDDLNSSPATSPARALSEAFLSGAALTPRGADLAAGGGPEPAHGRGRSRRRFRSCRLRRSVRPALHLPHGLPCGLAEPPLPAAPAAGTDTGIGGLTAGASSSAARAPATWNACDNADAQGDGSARRTGAGARQNGLPGDRTPDTAAWRPAAGPVLSATTTAMAICATPRAAAPDTRPTRPATAATPARAASGTSMNRPASRRGRAPAARA